MKSILQVAEEPASAGGMKVVRRIRGSSVAHDLWLK